jgi:GTP-binding protein Era
LTEAALTENPNFKSGFISIVGSPNVGKSTLMNAFVGQKVAIVTNRPQTTRNRIMGVLTRQDFQIIFIDTPGIHTPKNKLGQYMVKVAYDALNEVECILFMTDATAGIRERDEGILARLKRAKAPVVAAVNKVDIASKDKVKAALERLEAESWLNAVIPISAAKGEGLADLEGKFRSFLVPGPKYFPDDMVTDQPERVLCAEMIREQALLLLKEEVPHGLGVDIEKMEIRENGLTDIWATIYCERESHKGIIIGKGGAMLKEIGQRARGEIEWMLGARVNLQLWIKVKEDWRNRASTLRMLGYQDEN